MSKRSKPKARSSTGDRGQDNSAYESLAPGTRQAFDANDEGTSSKPDQFQAVANLRIGTENASKGFQNLIARRRLNRTPTDRSSVIFNEAMRLNSTLLKEVRHLGLDMEMEEAGPPIPRNSSNVSNGVKSPGGNGDISKVVTHAMNRKVIEHFVELAKVNNENDEVDLDHLQALFDQGADVNCSDKYGQTLLHEVARSWHTDVAVFLVKKGIDVNSKDRHGRTPLHVAAATDYPEMVEFLIENKADIESNTAGEGQTPLHFAARNDAVESCKCLIKLGAKIEARDYRQRTPLHVAAELDRSETARWLVENGAYVGVMDDSGQSCMTHMITKMGPVARDALDTFHKTDRANRKQYFYLNLLENDISDVPNKKANTPGLGGSLAKTPLQVIVSYKQLDIIMHPVILRMLELKWKQFGRMGAMQLLLINFLFILLWTILAVGVPWQTRYEYNFPTDAWILVIWIGAFGLTLYYVVIEIWEIVKSRRQFKIWKEWKEKLIDRDCFYTHPKWPEEAAYLEREKDALDDMVPAYFRDFWNYFDWTVYFLNFAVLITHVADVGAYTNATRPPPCCGSDGCEATAQLIRDGNITVKGSCDNGYVNNASLSAWNNRIFVLNIIMLWLRLMKNMRAFRMLGPFVVMLGKIFYDVLRFLFLYFEFYIPYACAFWMIFGDEVSISSMFTVDRMLFSLYRITLVDDYQFDEMQTFDIVMAYILCGTFLGISAILCINLFIALLSDTFQRVYDNAKANAFMQQAMLILTVEENLSDDRKKEFKKYIKTEGSPLAEYYDDDLTTLQDDDLKKVTIQIKDQMDDLIERLEISEKHERALFEGMALPELSSGTGAFTGHSKERYDNAGMRSLYARTSGLSFGRASSSGSLVAYGGLNKVSGDIKVITNAIHKMQKHYEKAQQKTQNELYEIKDILQKMMANEEQREEERKIKEAEETKKRQTPVVNRPVYPIEITTVQPVGWSQRRADRYDDLRLLGEGQTSSEVDGTPPHNPDLLRRLIHTHPQTWHDESPTPDKDYELIVLPGMSDLGEQPLGPRQEHGAPFPAADPTDSHSVEVREQSVEQGQSDGQDGFGSSNV